MTPENTSSPFDTAISELENRIRNMQITLETLKQLRTQPDGGVISSGFSRPAENEVRHDTFFEMTIADAVRKYLTMVKVTKSTADIADALERGGLKHSSKDFPTTVRSVLGQRDDFTRVPNGDWGLSEWYPGAGRGRKPKSEKQTITKRAPRRAKEPKSSTSSADQEPSATATKETAQEKILAAMLMNLREEWTQPKLIAVTGLKAATVAGTVFRLRKDGKIKSRDDGKGYVIA